MKVTQIIILFIFSFHLFAQPDPNWKKTGMHMRLKDDLDRKKDGWCLDAVGSGPHIRFNMPLIGHNCKPGLYADEAVIHRKDGTLFFPAYGACVTVMGLNEFALPGASLMLKNVVKRFLFSTPLSFNSSSFKRTVR